MFAMYLAIITFQLPSSIGEGTWVWQDYISSKGHSGTRVHLLDSQVGKSCLIPNWIMEGVRRGTDERGQDLSKAPRGSAMYLKRKRDRVGKKQTNKQTRISPMREIENKRSRKFCPNSISPTHSNQTKLHFHPAKSWAQPEQEGTVTDAACAWVDWM